MTDYRKAKYVSEAEQAYNKLSGIEKMLFDNLITQQFILLTNIAKIQERTDSKRKASRPVKRSCEEFEFPNDI